MSSHIREFRFTQFCKRNQFADCDRQNRDQGKKFLVPLKHDHNLDFV